LRVDVADASLVAATGVEAQVSVTAAWSAYRLLRADGSVERELLAAAPRTVVLVLRRPDAADPSTPATASPDRMWRVAEVRDPGAAGSTP